MSSPNTSDVFFEACATGDAEALRPLLSQDASLVHLVRPHAYGGTGLHVAAAKANVTIVRLLLEYGADPNARDAGDNATPLHFAAGKGHVETARVLLDAGADVHGHGDLHNQDIIGWATGWGPAEQINHDVIALLLERGARHHIFSALTIGDAELVRSVAAQDPQALLRRMSRFEQGKSPLHFAIHQKRYDLLKLLIDLGADLEGDDDTGKTALGMATLHADRVAIELLETAGAKPPKTPEPPPPGMTMETLASSVSKQVPMITVPDVSAALAWYTSLGFKELARYGDDGVLNFAMVAYGKAELMLSIGKAPARGFSLWFYTDRVDDLYKVLRARQPALEFTEDIYDAFYGARQFGIRDLNGYDVYFIQPNES